jgi:hypothetical protein
MRETKREGKRQRERKYEKFVRKAEKVRSLSRCNGSY